MSGGRVNRNGTRRWLHTAGLLCAAAVLAGCGNTAQGSGEENAGGPVVTVNGYDNMRFDPATITVKAGESITIQFANKGILPHDLITQGADQNANLANLGAGRQQRGVFKATKPGEYAFVCIQPGHKEAGMVGKIVVTN
jgi:plastocyanin